jgi:hypothetical protein
VFVLFKFMVDHFFFLSIIRPFLFLCFFKSLSQIFINRVLPARLDCKTRMLKLFPSSSRCFFSTVMVVIIPRTLWRVYYLCTDFPPPSPDKPLLVDVLLVIVSTDSCVIIYTLHGPWVHYDVSVVIILVKMKMVSHRPHIWCVILAFGLKDWISWRLQARRL